MSAMPDKLHTSTPSNFSQITVYKQESNCLLIDMSFPCFYPDYGEKVMLYAEIARKIREEFGDGRFSPGAQMPSENALVAAFSVSRSTVRKALKSLEQEGFLEQHQGQGTFLKQGRYQRNVSSRLDFISHGKRSGARPSTKLLSTEVREKSIAEISLFDTLPTARVFEIRRLRLMQERSASLQTSVLRSRILRTTRRASLRPGLSTRSSKRISACLSDRSGKR